MSAAGCVRFDGTRWTWQVPVGLGTFDGSALSRSERALGEVARAGDGTLRTLVYPLGSSERQEAFMELYRSAGELRKHTEARAGDGELSPREATLLTEARTAAWYMTQCAHSLLGTDQTDLDIVADNTEDVARHMTWFALAAGLLDAQRLPRRRWSRPVNFDRDSVAELWDAAGGLVTLGQDGERITVTFPPLPSPAPVR